MANRNLAQLGLGVLAGILHQRYVVQEVTAIGRAMECVSNESNRPSSIAC